MSKIPIGKLLLNFGYVTEEQLAIAMEIQKVRNKLLGEILVEQSFVSPKEIALALSKQTGKKYVEVTDYPSSEEALKIINSSIAKQLVVLPLSITADTFTVAMADPFDLNAMDILKRRSERELEIVVSGKEDILKRAEVLYYLLEKPLDTEIRAQLDFIYSKGSTADIPALISNIINNAIIERATDIHISPENYDTHIFFRIDGVLRHYYACPKSIHPALVSRVKILANMDISEQRIPQDGSMTHNFFDEAFDIRVSTLPTSFGENIVLRILSKNLSLFSLESLGFEDSMTELITAQFQRTQGIVLVTGPTGSGKTTTLYAGLRKINSLQRRIITAEDPIEYKFPFIKQTQINEKAGYTFATSMRAFLRQDPDVILLGEMRDEETAEMALRAAITGHLVLSTMHTSDAITAIPRLLDFKIKNFFIASALGAVMAQRLVRKVCNICKETREVRGEYLIKMGFDPQMLLKHKIKSDSMVQLAYGKGCDHCRKTGYSGRTVLSELLIMTPELGDMIVKGESPLSLLRKAQSDGMITMVEDGLIKSFALITNPEEVKRVLTW